MMRRSTQAALCCACSISLALGQQPSIEAVRPGGKMLTRPYRPVDVPPIRLADSERLGALIRGGVLYLTAQDAIALALENNIDLEIARYNPIIAAWNLERSEAGGALPGVPSGASQVGSVASGQGVAGSQAAAGVVGGGGGGGGTTVGNATVSQVGPVTQNLDPSFQESNFFSHTTTPEANTRQSVLQTLISNTRSYSGSVQQGFLSGGGVTVSYSDHYLNENAPSDILNPSSSVSVSLSFQHNLLRGFGIAVNARTIEINKINLQTSELNFRTQVMSVVANVLNSYYALAADYEDLTAKRSAYDTAQLFLRDTQRQEQLGALSQLDVDTAASQAASTLADRELSESNLRQSEVQLKNMLSRRGVLDPALAEVQVIPLDRIEVPESDTLPPLDELVKTALANRSDLAAEKASITTAEISSRGTRNGILPSAQAIGGTSQAGLSGPHGTRADPFFIGGIGNALGEAFRRDFPTERIGAFVQVPVNNRQAQADYGIDQLSLRQTQLNTQKDLNQVAVDLSNGVTALRQARARYRAAVEGRKLDEQLLDAEQKKYALGASIPYNVIVQQRDLTAARSTELAAAVSYNNARIALDQSLGATLDANHVSIGEARSGAVPRTSTLPATLPATAPLAK
jgi:outer membrane protein TolC